VLQAFFDADCCSVMISSKLCSSTNDNCTYTVTQLSRDIKAGKYHSSTVLSWMKHILALSKRCLPGKDKTYQWKKMHSIIICH
jgi:hypothetical protein